MEKKFKFKQFLIDMHEVINQPKYNHAGTVSQFLVEGIKHGATLSEAEKILREIESRVRLIGLPLHIYGEEYVSRIPIPGNEKTFKYALWVGMNGPIEIKKDLEKFKLNPTDVDMSLEETGFLVAGQKGI
jgi:hypothetical protein